MEGENKSIGDNNSILNDHRSTDSNNTSNSHNVSTHSIDNHSVDSHDTHIVNQNGFSINDVEKIAGMIQKAKEEGRQEVIELLGTVQSPVAPAPYKHEEPKHAIEPIPGSENYHEQAKPSQPSRPIIVTPPPPPLNFRRLLLVIVAIIVVGIVAHGIGGLFKKVEPKEEREVVQTEVASPPQPKQTQVKKTTTGSTPKATNTKQTVSTSKPTTKKVTTTEKQPQQIQSQQPQSVTPKVNPFTEAKAKADAGDATSCYKVAQAYMSGDGVAKNLQSAFLYMKTAAEQGYTPAYIEIAKMYHGGRGVTKNRDIAEQWYKKAANAGNAEAKRILLNM